MAFAAERGPVTAAGDVWNPPWAERTRHEFWVSAEFSGPELRSPCTTETSDADQGGSV